MSSLLWYVSGGRPDTHLHLFAWLVVLALYRDVWSVLSLVAISMTGHLLVMIGSVLPALATDPSPWTSVLWMSWLVGEAAFLVTFVAIDRQALKSQVDREAALEALQTKFQGKLESLTRQLVTERDSLQVEVTSLKETTAAAVSARTNAVQTLEALRHDVSSQGMEILRLASRPADSSLNKEWRTVWLALRRRAQHLTRLVDLSALEPDRGERSSFGYHSKDQHESVGHLSGDKRAMLLIRNPVQQNKATAALEALGYKVDVVTSGPKTYYSVMLNDYSTIVVDIDLPGDEGFDTLEALRLLPPGRVGATKCLFALTAEMTPDRVLRCTNLNVDGMLLKPLHTDALRKALHPEGHPSRERRRPHRSTSTSTQRR
jgi:CheY-like chemotaxis protein